jgi:hypothetical protein
MDDELDDYKLDAIWGRILDMLSILLSREIVVIEDGRSEPKRNGIGKESSASDLVVTYILRPQMMVKNEL